LGCELPLCRTRRSWRVALVTNGDATAQAALADWSLRDRAAALRLFVKEARVPAASARLALGFALRESVWMGSDPAVNDAKSRWWIEELALSGQGGARHPLTRMLSLEEARVDFSRLARALSGLRTTTPEHDHSRTLAPVRDMESTLWFGPDPVEDEACLIRARACLVDVLERRAHGAVASEASARAIAAHGAELRAARAVDPWTVARRAQALCWIDSMGSAAVAMRVRRWREVWAVWRAIRKVPGRTKRSATAGEQSGT